MTEIKRNINMKKSLLLTTLFVSGGLILGGQTTAKASVAHATPHVAPHVSPHVSRPPVRVAPRPSATPHVNKPAKSAPHNSTKPKASTPKTTGENAKQGTGSPKEPKSVQKVESDIKKGMNSSKQSYNQSEVDSIFKSNNVSSVYSDQYRRQSIISNPWFWMYMLNHNRISKDRNSEQYLAGYKAGTKYANLDKKSKSTKNQDPKKNKKVTKTQLNNKDWKKGYSEGYSDTMLSN